MRSRRSIIAIVLCAGMFILVGLLVRCYVRAGPPNKGASMQAERPASKQPDLEASEQTGTGEPDIRASSWKVLAGYHLSSVAWSPGGDYIAFVATPKASSEEYEEEMPEYADIWLLEAPVKDVRLKRLIRLNSGEISVALFWMSDTEIGWATGGDEDGFTFFAVDLKGGKPRQLVPLRFRMLQSRTGRRVWAPNDVQRVPLDPFYKDIAFTCSVPGGRSGGPLELLGVYCPWEGALATTPVYDVGTPVTFCTVPPGSFNAYVATVVPARGDRIAKSVISNAGNYFFMDQRDEVVTELGCRILFPRSSPDGKRLAWLSASVAGRERAATDKLVVYDLSSRARKVATSLSSYWDIPAIGLGCPYSWSPTGEEIAYADGSVVKTVGVPADAFHRK